jgi:hypothetical protein
MKADDFFSDVAPKKTKRFLPMNFLLMLARKQRKLYKNHNLIMVVMLA